MRTNPNITTTQTMLLIGTSSFFSWQVAPLSILSRIIDFLDNCQVIASVKVSVQCVNNE